MKIEENCMQLEILLSCMNQVDISLIKKSGIVGNVLMINQCDKKIPKIKQTV